MAVIELNGSEFDAFVAGNATAVVDCWAPWCGPCRRMGPVIDELAADLEGRVAVGKLNTDDNQDIAARFGINAIPTILIFKGGKLAGSLVGLRPKEDVVSAIESLRCLRPTSTSS